MKLNSDLNKMLNIQMTKEFFNEKLYQAMEGYFRSLGLKGFAH